MMNYSRVVFLFTLFLCLWNMSEAEKIRKCKKNDICKCTFEDDNSVINLWPLVNGYERKPVFKDYKGPGNTTYSYNPCKPFDEGNCKNSLLCRTLSQSISLADTNNVNIEMRGKDIDLVYNHDAFTSRVRLICDPTYTMAIFKPGGGVPRLINHYAFNLTTKHACALTNQGSDNTLSTGSILLIIFFSLVGLYFIIGILDGIFRRQDSGMKVIPNYEFWSSLPGHISHGFGYVITCSCFSARKRTYDEV